MKEQKVEELTGVGSMAMEQRRTCREDGDLPEHCNVEEEERQRR
jgi:hypothetical protein